MRVKTPVWHGDLQCTVPAQPHKASGSNIASSENFGEEQAFLNNVLGKGAEKLKCKLFGVDPKVYIYLFIYLFFFFRGGQGQVGKSLHFHLFCTLPLSPLTGLEKTD